MDRIGTAAMAAATLAFNFMLSSVATSRTLYVTNDGTDSASCGAQTSTCRSISQGMENAVAGDVILVGAGRYGNISGSASYTGPGDEHPQQLTLPFVTGCIVCIDKAVSIYSLHGPSVTVIEGAPLTFLEATVLVHSEGVHFGAPGRGFTLTGGAAFGVDLDQNSERSAIGILLKKDVSIAGNVDIGDAVGFQFQGLELTDAFCPDPACIDTSTITFMQNEAIDNQKVGFNVSQELFRGGPILVEYNYARGGGIGFNVPAGPQTASSAPSDSGKVTLLGNVAEHNGLGFYALRPGSMTSNTAASNSGAGFQIVASAIAFQGNTAVGNGGPGAIVQFFDSRDVPDVVFGFKSFSQNNFYGNDRNRPHITVQISETPDVSYNLGPGAHCGVLNLGVEANDFQDIANPPNIAPLDASKNFWGTTHGPSATGAADAVGGKCDERGGKTTVSSFLTAGVGIVTH
jgi:hypothetical protein